MKRHPGRVVLALALCLALGMGCVGGGWASSAETASAEDWRYKVDGDGYAVITRYLGSAEEVVVPSAIDGYEVRTLGSLAFNRSDDIRAVRLPAGIAVIESWAMYDLNGLLELTFAGTPEQIASDAFISSNASGVTVYASAQTEALLRASVSEMNAGAVFVTDVTPEVPTLQLGESAGSASGSASGESSGSPTAAGEAVWAEGFAPEETGLAYDKTFRNLTAQEAEELNASLSGTAIFAARLAYTEGFWLNGTQVELAPDVKAWDAETGILLYDGSGQSAALYAAAEELPDAFSGESYQYVGYRTDETGMMVAELYYSPFALSSNGDSSVVAGVISPLTGEEAPVNGMTGQAEMDPVYRSFVNAVITADGETVDLTEDASGELTLYSEAVGDDGNEILARTNRERSVLHATNGGTIVTGAVNLISTSTIDNAKMSVESGTRYNEEIGMEWGITAVAYATQGGVIVLGDPDGDLDGNNTSYVTANGETTNGAIAVTTGTEGSTSQVYVYNTVMEMQGWNNHVADVMYGGYIYLENVIGSNGIAGSYALGQSGTITNDFGNGVIEGRNVTSIGYGNRTAGSYVIGGGIICLEQSSLKCYTDGGAVIASGGTFRLTDCVVEGVSGLKMRGGNSYGTVSEFTGCSFIAVQDYPDAGYVYGEEAAAAIDIWNRWSGGNALAGFYMSETGYTMGELCRVYGIEDRDGFYAELDTVLDRDEVYTDETLLRGSMLDNTFYNYNGGLYAETDYHDIPYLTIGPFGGLTQSVIVCEAGGSNAVFTDCVFTNENDPAYNYLIASEAASYPKITFDHCAGLNGIIWNEGTNTNRTADGRSAKGDSYIDVTFVSSDFTGSFADGSNGIGAGPVSYTDASGEMTDRAGNYYGAESNFGITAVFDAGSAWYVTGDSYLGLLTVEPGAVLAAADGVSIVSVCVGGQTVSLDTLAAGGSFEQVVIETAAE